MEAPRPKRGLPILTEATQRPTLEGEARPIDKAFRPVYAVWELTLACDLSCRHCGSRAGKARPDELTTAEALDLVRQMHELGVKEIALIGGEAYLHDGWTDVIREMRSLGIESTMVTGGRGLTIERARAGAEAGLQSVAVSIDGDAETHDRLRGVDGSHASAVQALQNCRAAGMQVALNTQVNRLSAPHLREIFDLLIRVGGHGWQLQLTVPVGRAADEPEVVLQPYDLLTVYPILAELKQKCDAAKVIMLAGNNIGYFGPYEHILRSYCRSGYRRSCSAGLTTLGIESNGDVKGCPSLPTDKWVGGNVRDEKLARIWELSAELRHMRDRTSDELWGFCATCYYAKVCKAGCTWMSSSLFGRPGNNPYCHHRTIELSARGKRERVVQVEAAPGLPFDYARWEIIEEEMP